MTWSEELTVENATESVLPRRSLPVQLHWISFSFWGPQLAQQVQPLLWLSIKLLRSFTMYGRAVYNTPSLHRWLSLSCLTKSHYSATAVKYISALQTLPKYSLLISVSSVLTSPRQQVYWHRWLIMRSILSERAKNFVSPGHQKISSMCGGLVVIERSWYKR